MGSRLRRAAFGVLLFGACMMSPSATASTAAVPDAAGTGPLVSLPANRIMDTRRGFPDPLTAKRLAPGATDSIGLTGTPGMPPELSGFSGTVLLNVTIVGPASAGYLTLYSTWDPRPATSSINFAAHRVTAGLVAVRYESGGLNVYNAAAGSVDVAIDVEGYYVEGPRLAGPGAFQSVPAMRLYDSRAFGAPLGGARSVVVTAGGRAGIPASGVRAVLADLIAVAPGASGYLSTWAYGSSPPATSALNFARGRTTSGLSVVPVDGAGRLILYNGAGSATHVVVDVFGYIVAGAAHQAGMTTVLSPARVLDTRTGLGAPRDPVSGTKVVSLHVLGRGGVPATGVSTVTLNVVAVRPTSAGYVTVRAGHALANGTSTLNFAPDTVATSNPVIAPVGPDGTVDLAVTGTGRVDLVADVQAYSAPPTIVTGRVTDQAGHPVAALLSLRSVIDGKLGLATTDADGRFTFGGVDGDSVHLCVDDKTPFAYLHALGSQCWNRVPLGQPQTVITPTAGQAFVADVVLSPGAALIGSITDSSARPITATVELTVGNAFIGSASSSASAEYAFSGLSAESYVACFSAQAQSGAPYGYVGRCFGQSVPNDPPTPITLTAGTVTRIDAPLALAGGVSGTIFLGSGQIETRIGYTLRLRDVRSGDTLVRDVAGGTYAVAQIPSGTYAVCVASAWPFVLPTCDDGSLPPQVVVTAGDGTDGVDFHVAVAGVLFGHVSDASGAIPGAAVTVTSSAKTTTTTTTDASGAYRFDQLPLGDYTVCFHATGHSDRCYQDARDPQHATPVTVSSARIGPIDQTLPSSN